MFNFHLELTVKRFQRIGDTIEIYIQNLRVPLNLVAIVSRNEFFGSGTPFLPGIAPMCLQKQNIYNDDGLELIFRLRDEIHLLHIKASAKLEKRAVGLEAYNIIRHLQKCAIFLIE